MLPENCYFKLFLLYLAIAFFENINCSLQGEEVSQWANAVGRELWILGQEITRFSELKQKYTFHNAKVGSTYPDKLLDEIKKSIEIMVERKVSAIEAIQEKAEEAAVTFIHLNETFDYHSSRYSNVSDMPLPPDFFIASVRKNEKIYRPMQLNNDSHFYNLAVNTNYSSVHVPVNIYDREEAAVSTIQWSENLDEVFTKNYKKDPALSWQYFGSTTGIMRHYPAHRWNTAKRELLLFDCRIRTWFIEAATCTKDVVVLIDNSGSMDGLGHHIGSLTAKSILDTFSNNDYVNIMNYTDQTSYLIPCFANMLVQATEENIELFKGALNILKPEGKTQIGQALELAFDLLAKTRIEKNCDQANGTCNQAIMIITDGVNSNLSDVIMKHNYLNNGSNIPVRLFTYLIGKEVTNVAEIQWISCANRGYYTHVQSLEQVTASVLQYISVIARPLVLQGVDHPVSWTHAYADLTYDDKNDMTVNEPYRLLSSAAIPCYGTKYIKTSGNDTATPYLLGVAGTDVPLDEFEKLTVKYRLGVNGYAFIISNNGYVLMHPDLRPVFKGVLKDNYNSIDITQVEQHFSVDGKNDGPREIVPSVMKLRNDLIYTESGSYHGVKIKYHYDDMTRVFESVFDYYFTRVNNTPFTIGIAVPQAYGDFSLEVGDEITKNKHTGMNITSFFKGKWKIHPKWIYCKYHYLEGHEYPSAEAELLHFLNKIYDDEFKWERQYEAAKKELGDDDYYCDKDLVQRLIFDAKITNDIFGEKGVFSPRDQIIFERYKVFLRFVATMSGLTRWDYISEQRPTGTKSKEFGELHPRAINEKWYKSAVLQHHYDESFVYSVPARKGYTSSKDTEITVTASFAIFPSDGGKEAPGSVVGFQFSQFALHNYVLYNISNKASNRCSQSSHCSTCGDNLDCYIIDSSGYILVSKNLRETSKLFGELEGDIMQSLIDEGVFKKVTVYDYQALCLKQPEFQEAHSEVTDNDAEMDDSTEDDKLQQNFTVINDGDETEPQFSDNNVSSESNEENNPEDYFACETKLNLFVLQQDLFINQNFQGEITSSERNYYIKRIPNSNLYFVAINSTIKKKSNISFTTTSQQYTQAPSFTLEDINSTLLPCQKLNLNSLSRRRLAGCYNEHPLEHETVDCGAYATDVKTNISLIVILALILVAQK